MKSPTPTVSSKAHHLSWNHWHQQCQAKPTTYHEITDTNSVKQSPPLIIKSLTPTVSSKAHHLSWNHQHMCSHISLSHTTYINEELQRNFQTWTCDFWLKWKMFSTPSNFFFQKKEEQFVLKVDTSTWGCTTLNNSACNKYNPSKERWREEKESCPWLMVLQMSVAGRLHNPLCLHGTTVCLSVPQTLPVLTGLPWLRCHKSAVHSWTALLWKMDFRLRSANISTTVLSQHVSVGKLFFDQLRHWCFLLEGTPAESPRHGCIDFAQAGNEEGLVGDGEQAVVWTVEGVWHRRAQHIVQIHLTHLFNKTYTFVSTNMECDYIYGWITKWSHTQISHPKWRIPEI